MKIPKISIITPVWNQAHLTHRFLSQNWAIYAGWPDIEWIVIDNGSTDNTGHILGVWQQSMGDQLKRINSEENIGFGPGNNLGVEAAIGDIFIFLSNDVQILGDYITPIRQAVKSNKMALYGPEIFSHNTGWNTFNEIGPIAYVAGWCVAAHRDFWGEVGPWDERFIPCDYEDMDLSHTVQTKGYPIIKVNLPLKHDSGKSAEALPGGRQAITLKNRDRFMGKWRVTLK
jgi:GT2 family glycosyltransferase